MRSHAGLPAFAGVRYQRGHGLGNTVRRLTKMMMPEIKKKAKVVGKHALNTGIKLVSDVMQGKSLKTSVKKRAMESIKHVVPKRGPPGERVHKPKPKPKKSYKRNSTAKRKVIRSSARQQKRWRDALA